MRTSLNSSAARRRPPRLAIAAIAGTMVMLAACGGSGDEGGGSSEGDIIVATDLPLTSQFSSQAGDLKDGYELAIAEVNAAGGVLDRQIKLLVTDDNLDPARTKELTNAAASRDKAVALLGTWSSTLGLAQSAEAERFKLPNIQAFSAAGEMTKRDLAYVFNMFTSTEQAEEVSDDYILNEVKPKSIAIFYQDADYSIPAAEASRDRLTQGGVDVKVFEKFPITLDDFTSLVAKARSEKVDAIKLLGLGPAHTAMMVSLKQLNFAPKLVYTGTQVGVEERQITALKDDADLVVGTPSWYTGRAPEIEAKFQDKFGKAPTIENIQGYAAVQILVAAIEQAGSPDSEAIRKALSDGEFDTVTGKYVFDENGQAETEVTLVQLQDLKPVPIWPAERASGESKPFLPWSQR